jgi:hypothetical protein
VTNSGEVIRSIKEDTEDQRYWKSWRWPSRVPDGGGWSFIGCGGRQMSTWSSPTRCSPLQRGEEEGDDRLLWRVGHARYRIGIQARPLGGLACWASAHWPSSSLFFRYFYFSFILFSVLWF